MSDTDDIDRAVEIERLAALDPLDYDIERTEAAKRLKVRAAVLDRVVAKKRRQLGLDTDDEEEKGQGRTVKIDDVLPWPEPVSGDQIATTLEAAIKTYAVLPDAAVDAIVLWVLHTWLVNSFSISPRLAITSPTKGCGKTTILKLLQKLVRRPKRAGSISPAALFRVVEQFQPTILLDETEKYVEHGSDLHALLCEGHATGGTVLRVLGDQNELREFSVFGAVAFAHNGRMPDDLEQRSIVIEMKRRRADEVLAELRADRGEQFHRVARMCARWAEDVAADIGGSDPDMGWLINRNADNWRPLFAIADLAGEDWPQRARGAAEALTPRESDSIGPMLLADIKAVFDQKTVEPDRIASVDLCKSLAEMEARPWPEWKASKGASAKPITATQLARLLNPFGIIPDTMRIGTRLAKGYYRHRFEEAWARYVAAEGVAEPLQRNNATAADTSDTFRDVTPEHDVTDQKTEKPLEDGPCYGVTAQNGGEPGLGERDVFNFASEAEEWFYQNRDRLEGDYRIETKVRELVINAGVLPEFVDTEVERVLCRIFGKKAH